MRRVAGSAAAVAGAAGLAVVLATASVGHAGPAPARIDHVVVVDEENHSFDNLFGGWGPVGGRPVDGAGGPGFAAHAGQVAADGTALACLPQVDVNLASPPVEAGCGSVRLADGTPVGSGFANRPFDITTYLRPSDTTCPAPDVTAVNGVGKGQGLPGGCTRDLVHRFYNEQFQLDRGRMDRYTLGSDAAGLTQGYYDTTKLPVHIWLHGSGAPHYVIADRFFAGSFGGSFLNHQYLIAARAPLWAGWTIANPPHSVLDPNGMPAGTPLYPNTVGADNPLTQACGQPTTVVGRACGDYAVNTVQPFNQPYAPGTADAKRLPPIDDAAWPNIGDRLTAAGVTWAWYAGGWDNAAGNTGGPGWTNGTTRYICSDPDHKAGSVYPNCPGNLFQYHHQPFAYFAEYAPGRPGREHLQDEKAFLAAAATGTLPAVAFVKPYGEENEHPGYASTVNGQSHLVELLKAIDTGPQADGTLVVVTYDEFGGQWDHVPPPGSGAPGVHDPFGPGTRLPTLILGRPLQRDGVDSTTYDTTSITATIEHLHALAPLDTKYHRDRHVHDLSRAVAAGGAALPVPPGGTGAATAWISLGLALIAGVGLLLAAGRRWRRRRS